MIQRLLDNYYLDEPEFLKRLAACDSSKDNLWSFTGNENLSFPIAQFMMQLWRDKPDAIFLYSEDLKRRLTRAEFVSHIQDHAEEIGKHMVSGEFDVPEWVLPEKNLTAISRKVHEDIREKKRALLKVVTIPFKQL